MGKFFTAYRVLCSVVLACILFCHHAQAQNASAAPAPSSIKSAAALAAIKPSAGQTPTADEIASLATLPAKEVLKVPLPQTEPMAVFAQDRTIWFVVGEKSALPKDFLDHTDLHLVKDIHKINEAHARAFVFDVYPGITASVAPAASGTTVEIIFQKAAPAKLLEVMVPHLSSDDDKRFIFCLSVGKDSELIQLHDAVSRHNLEVVLTSKPGEGIAGEHSFDAFTLLPSSQGAAFSLKSSNLIFVIENAQLNVSSLKDTILSIAQIPEIDTMEKEALKANGITTLFPYVLWKIADEKDLVPFEVHLMHEISFNSPVFANKKRLRLLELYLAEGLFVEAHGMANDILRSSYRYYRDNNVAALRGAALFFMGRYAEAERDFSAPEFAGNAEVTLWRSLCKELQGETNTDPVFNFLNNYPTYIKYYPPVFIQKLGLIAADREIVHKDYDATLNIFEQLKKDGLDEPIRKYIDYMRGVVFSETKEELEAAKIWEQQAGDLDDRLIRARAEFSLVNLLLRQYKISNEDAAKRLEKLRIVWRGDALELSVLTLLSNLYIEDKKYDKALYTLRDIVQYYPEMPDTVYTARKMAEIFQTLYNKDAADSMPPLEALSLFYEFRDLVPLGKDGDMMIRNLSDRLVRIDLLDRAELLLDHQIRKRLTGMERSRVGARLALIYLLDHKPKEALETLKTTGYGEIPGDLQLTRTQLTAQALAEQGEAAKAIEVLANDSSSDGNILRLSIYWGNKDWTNVVATSEEILGNRNDPTATLTPQESDVLLKLATAYVYEHDTGQIQYLRDYFTPLLKDKEKRDNFLFITSESGAVDYENLPNLDQDIGSVKNFLDNYREKVRKDGLSNAL